MTAEEYMRPPFLTILSMLFSLTACSVLGKIRDFFFHLLHPFERATKQGYAPVRDPTEDFFMRRMYGRIVDCWNRPICSSPDAWMDVMERKCVRTTTGNDLSSIVPTGTSRRVFNLGSYNYLGFAAHDQYCTPRCVETIKEYGVSGCSPRVHAGTTAVHTELEELVAKFLGVEAAITYGMGFATNSATIPALAGKGDLVISDALNHSSIVAGVRTSGARVKVFRHNDADHLEMLLRENIAEGQPRTRRPWRKILVIVEGVYSMEGETCNLKPIVEVCKKYKAYVYVDEAHSIGAMGPTGRGICEHAGVATTDMDCMMGTFTKAFGSCGGYIAGKKSTIDYLRANSPAHTYACAMAPGTIQQCIGALHVMMGLDGSDRGARKCKQLHDNANYVRARLLRMGMDTLGSWDSPVMPIMTYHVPKMVTLSRECLARHIAMVVVGFPATPLLLTRARICISAAHSREDLDWCLEQLEQVFDMCNMKYHNKDLYNKVEADLKEHVEIWQGPLKASKISIAQVAEGAVSVSSCCALDGHPANLSAGKASGKKVIKA